MTWEEAVLWLRSQPDQAALVRDCYFDDPLSASAERYRQSTEWQAVRRLLPHPPGRALDIGAGRGISSYSLCREGWETTALEPDPSAVVGAGAIRALAGESGLSITVVEGSGEDLPFEDRTFDLVYCRQALHHARDLQLLCGEMMRVLKRGGMFIATREHVISRREDLQAFLDSHPLHRLYGGEHAYLPSEYIAALKQAGFEPLRVLNPLASEINLFPDTRAAYKERLAARCAWPWPRLVPDGLLTVMGHLIGTPGRLYTYIGKKPL